MRPKLKNSKKNPGHSKGFFHGERFKEIKVWEMYRFLGILLRISLQPMTTGGYKQYFSKSNFKVHVDSKGSNTVEVPMTAGWASQYMSLRRFLQIRGCFHPNYNDPDRQAGGKYVCALYTSSI